MSIARLFVIASLAALFSAAVAADVGRGLKTPPPPVKAPPARLETPPSGPDASAPRVSVVSTPEDGIQPQAVVDDRGTIHIVYFKGDAAGGDIYYTRLAGIGAGAQASPPVRVNTI